MFKLQPKKDIAQAVDYIISNNPSKFQKFKEFKKVDTKRFSNVVTILAMFLMINGVLIAIKFPAKYIVALMITEGIMFALGLYNLKKPYPEYEDVADMFSKEAVKNAFKDINIQENGHLYYINIDTVVVENHLKD